MLHNIVIISSVIAGNCASKSADQKAIQPKGFAEKNYHQYNASDVGYYTGRNLTSELDDDEDMICFIQDGPDVVKKIVKDHVLNVYDHIMGGLYPGVPAYVQTDDDKWYKVDNATREQRRYISSLNICTDDNKTPYLGPEDFKPAKVRFEDGYLKLEDQCREIDEDFIKRRKEFFVDD